MILDKNQVLLFLHFSDPTLNIGYATQPFYTRISFIWPPVVNKKMHAVTYIVHNDANNK